jgi:hypothetical protein
MGVRREANTSEEALPRSELTVRTERKKIHLTAEGRFPSRGILAAIIIFSCLCQMNDRRSSSIVMWHDISMWPLAR